MLLFRQGKVNDSTITFTRRRLFRKNSFLFNRIGPFYFQIKNLLSDYSFPRNRKDKATTTRNNFDHQINGFPKAITLRKTINPQFCKPFLNQKITPAPIGPMETIVTTLVGQHELDSRKLRRRNVFG